MNKDDLSPTVSVVSHILILAEEGDDDFRVRRCSGFDDMAVRRFGDVPCTVYLRGWVESLQEIIHLERLVDMPGLQEACGLASRIRTRPGPLRTPAYPSTSKMPPFDRVRQTRRLAWLRIEIRFNRNRTALTIRNQIDGFDKTPCSHLMGSVMFPEIKKFVEKWGFDTEGTVFDCE